MNPRRKRGSQTWSFVGDNLYLPNNTWQSVHFAKENYFLSDTRSRCVVIAGTNKPRYTMSERTCDQCTAKSDKTGQRCKRRTCKSDLCWQHLRTKEDLMIKPSHIRGAGDGLYATTGKYKTRGFDGFKKGETIAQYKGRLLTKQQLDRKYPGDTLAPYAVQVTRNTFMDAPKSNMGAARFANACRTANKRKKECKGNNAKLVANARAKSVKLKAVKKIKPGEEIYTSYGRQYWR